MMYTILKNYPDNVKLLLENFEILSCWNSVHKQAHDEVSGAAMDGNNKDKTQSHFYIPRG